MPELVGNGVRLRELRDSDICRRASLGCSREIVRGFGAGIDADEPMTEQDAAEELRRRFGPGPHWVIADQDDVFILLRAEAVKACLASENGSKHDKRHIIERIARRSLTFCAALEQAPQPS